jgi:hypothetical protein
MQAQSHPQDLTCAKIIHSNQGTHQKASSKRPPVGKQKRSRGTRATRAFAGSVAAGLVLLVSCGTPEKTQSSCAIDLPRDSKFTEDSGKKKVLYRGSFSNECKEVYENQSGKGKFKLNVTSPKLVGGKVTLVQAGERTFSFADGLSLEEGSVETRFGSDTLKQWAFPWVDKPGTAVVTVVAPADAAEADFPTKILFTMETAEEE